MIFEIRYESYDFVPGTEPLIAELTPGDRVLNVETLYDNVAEAGELPLPVGYTVWIGRYVE